MMWIEYVRLLQPDLTQLVEQAEALVRRLDNRFPSLPEMCGTEAMIKEEEIRLLKLKAFYRLKRRECALYRCIECMHSHIQIDDALAVLDDACG
jgi:hypothetical protein